MSEETEIGVEILVTHARGFTRIHLVAAIRAMVVEVLELIPVSLGKVNREVVCHKSLKLVR